MANEKRLIDANAIVQFIMDGLNNPDKMKALWHDAIEILAEIEFAPTVDAVEVVRCKDCCWGEMATPLDGGTDHLVCCRGTSIENPIVSSADENHYCSYGERRE